MFGIEQKVLNLLHKRGLPLKSKVSHNLLFVFYIKIETTAHANVNLIRPNTNLLFILCTTPFRLHYTKVYRWYTTDAKGLQKSFIVFFFHSISRQLKETCQLLYKTRVADLINHFRYNSRKNTFLTFNSMLISLILENSLILYYRSIIFTSEIIRYAMKCLSGPTI